MIPTSGTGVRGIRESQFSPQYFQSGENTDLSLLIIFPDQFLKLIGSTMPQTRLLHLGHFSAFDFPGHSPVMPRELGKFAGS